MSVTERQALDFSLLIMKTYDLADALLRSAELSDYLYWKDRMEKDAEAKRSLTDMARAKERFAECERFGHFHPNYHEALEAVKTVESELEKIVSVREFKKAEQALDELLYDVSVTIAHSVSDSVKVPGNNLIAVGGSCGSCGSGGSCGCR